MVAVCAWILPGISGSFVLLLLGLYSDVIAAVNSIDLMFLMVLACGCASGLLLFTRLLGWLLSRYHDALLASLTGFMATGLVKLWPWQALVTGQDPHAGGAFSYLRWPNEYALTGADAFFPLALFAGCLGGSAYGCCPSSLSDDPKKAGGLSRWIRVFVLTGFLTACVAPGTPVVTDRSQGKPGQTTYTVARGDTLYSIAWRFNLDYRRFAAANQIGSPFTIYPGQRLRLTELMPPRASKKQSTATVAKSPSKPKRAQTQSAAKSRTANSGAARRPEPARTPTQAPQKPASQGSKTWYQPLPQKPSVVFGKNSKGWITPFRPERGFVTREAEKWCMPATVLQGLNVW